jgi:N-acetylmuramoyl-L-alanine amidase
MNKTAIFNLALVMLLGCAKHPYTTSNKSYKQQVKAYAKTLRKEPALFSTEQGKAPYWVGTTNFNMRKPNLVIIHHTAQNSCEQTLKTFTLQRTQVSAHYVICKDGTVHHMLNDYLRAWHGGIGKWGNITDINSSSIGIEIDNNGFEAFTDPQMNSLLRVLDTLKKRHGIPTANFIGHSDIAPTRKVDPNVNFSWQTLAKRGFGLWYDEVRDTIPYTFNSMQALRIIGYDTKDSIAAIGAFKRKFLQQDKSRELTTEDKRILYNLMKKNL